MVELLGYLESNGFYTYIVSGSGVDFMRSICLEVFGIPPERVIGSSSSFEYVSDDTGGSIRHQTALAFLDDGPQKPIQIWGRIGRRPLVAGGNSNGDLPMLEFARHPERPSLRLLINHDDAEREVAYASGAETALAKAKDRGWTVVSMQADWTTVFRTADSEA
jgi:phosphoserine phosphatase